MIVYKHTIFLRKLSSLYKSIFASNYFLYFLIFAILFGIILLFGGKITSTINDGLDKQARIDKITKEVEALEEKHEDLQYQKELLNSETSLEAEIRENNKKKEGEEIYVISLPQVSITPTDSASTTNKTISPEIKMSNWEKWIQKLFQ